MSSIELGMTDYRLKAAADRLEDLHDRYQWLDPAADRLEDLHDRYQSLDPAAAADAALSDQIVVHTCIRA